ncbi:unnamed protein product, partial [Polarella glacialis]
NDPVLKLPFYWYRPRCQLGCAVLVGAMCAIAGVLLLVQSGQMQEVTILYKAGESSKEFTIDKEFSDDVYLYYELPGLNLNRKDFVESKDKNVATTVVSPVTCLDSDSRSWANWRRAGDTAFLARIAAVAGTGLAPCGLVGISMFTDEFTFDKKTPSSTWGRVEADETEVALPGDATAYSKKVQAKGGKLVINGQESWISTGSFYEHWKVWYRTPASSTVRNLWAVVKGGLKTGTYRVNFVENSPIWETWGVPEKRLVIAGKHALGSQGAMRALGGTCLAVAGLELLAFLVFCSCLVLRKNNNSNKNNNNNKNSSSLSVPTLQSAALPPLEQQQRQQQQRQQQQQSAAQPPLESPKEPSPSRVAANLSESL